MPAQKNHLSSTTATITIRMQKTHLSLLKKLPPSETASSLVRALLAQYFDGVELPVQFRALKARRAAEKIQSLFSKNRSKYVA